MKKYRIRQGSPLDKAREAGKYLLAGALTFCVMFAMGCDYMKATSEPPPVIETIEVTTNNYTYNVPLASELQLYITNLSEDYGIDPALIIAMIGVESSYKADCIGDGGDSVGLMQIQPRWWSERMAELGVTNLANPYENATIGIDIIAGKLAEGQGVEWALMAYNGGNQYANEMTAAGQVSEYATKVMAEAYELTYERMEGETK